MIKKADTDTQLKYSLSFWQRVRRTPYQTIASILMISVTLFVLSIFLLAAVVSSSVLSYFETKPQITVFFKDEQTNETIETLAHKLKETGKLGSYKYVSKEEALKIYREQNKDDPLLLEMVTADILPASLEISATNPQFLGEIAEIVKKEKEVDEVVFQKEIVDTLVSWTSVVRKVGAVFILFLLLATLMILVTSIGMKIANRKDEIEILKLVGATSWYIKRPFIMEGVIYGLIGSTLSFSFSTIIFLYLTPFINAFLQGIPPLVLFKVNNFSLLLWPPNIWLFVLLWVVLAFAGFLIGLIGSLFSLSRYMKY